MYTGKSRSVGGYAEGSALPLHLSLSLPLLSLSLSHSASVLYTMYIVLAMALHIIP